MIASMLELQHPYSSSIKASLITTLESVRCDAVSILPWLSKHNDLYLHKIMKMISEWSPSTFDCISRMKLVLRCLCSSMPHVDSATALDGWSAHCLVWLVEDYGSSTWPLFFQCICVVRVHDGPLFELMESSGPGKMPQKLQMKPAMSSMSVRQLSAVAANPSDCHCAKLYSFKSICILHSVFCISHLLSL